MRYSPRPPGAVGATLTSSLRAASASVSVCWHQGLPRSAAMVYSDAARAEAMPSIDHDAWECTAVHDQMRTVCQTLTMNKSRCDAMIKQEPFDLLQRCSVPCEQLVQGCALPDCTAYAADPCWQQCRHMKTGHKWPPAAQGSGGETGTHTAMNNCTGLHWDLQLSACSVLTPPHKRHHHVCCSS